jgi:hypothetical protein
MEKVPSSYFGVRAAQRNCQANDRSGSSGDITGWRSGRSAGGCAGSGNYRPPATALNLGGLAFVSDYIVS